MFQVHNAPTISPAFAAISTSSREAVVGVFVASKSAYLDNNLLGDDLSISLECTYDFPSYAGWTGDVADVLLSGLGGTNLPPAWTVHKRLSLGS